MEGSALRFVLYAAPLASAPVGSKKMATVISGALGARLVLLRVCATQFAPRVNDPVRRPINGHRRFDFVLSERSMGQLILTRAGDFWTVVSETVRTFHPAFIVIPDLSAGAAASLHQLAVEWRTPVLLAREFCASGVILAATSLEQTHLPVLRTAAFLSSSLEAPAVFLHNLVLVPPREHESAAKDRGAVIGRLDALANAAASLGIESQNVVTLRPTNDEAVLSTVHRERPDVVVIGVRRSPNSGALEAPPLASRIIDEIAASVLLVPLDATVRVGLAAD